MNTNTLVHTDQGPEALERWIAEKSVGRNEDLRLWSLYRENADAAIEHLIHAKFSQKLSSSQLDGVDDEYDGVCKSSSTTSLFPVDLTSSFLSVGLKSFKIPYV